MLPSPVLPDGYMWPDGTLASFEDWPELEEAYEAGKFEGYVLPASATDEDKKNYPGKWVLAANSAGLYTPRLTGLFARYCGGTDGDAGMYHRDEIRNIVGNSTHMHVQPSGGVSAWGGALGTITSHLASALDGASQVGLQIQFDASRVVPTGPENVPQHYKQPIALYLGKSPQI